MTKAITFRELKAEYNWENSFLDEADKFGDLMITTVVIDNIEFHGRGVNEEQAVKNLKERINNYFNAKKHEANLKIDRAIEQYFFE